MLELSYCIFAWVICLLSALADESMTLCIKVSNADLFGVVSNMFNWNIYSIHQVILQIINTAIHNKINHQQQNRKVLPGQNKSFNKTPSIKHWIISF